MLDHATAAPLTLVTAPAGFGKSVALRHWADQRDRVAWLSLDAEDAAPRCIAAGIAAALAGPEPGAAGHVRAALAGLAAPSAAEIAAAVEGALSAVDAPLVLLVDDAHSDVHAVLGPVVEAFLRHPVPALRLVVSQRELLPVSHERYRLHGLLREIGPDDLRFTGAEAARLARQHALGDAGDGIAATLCDVTGGWPVGLRLALQAIGDACSDLTAVDAGAVGRDAIDAYLEAEVLDRQPGEIRELLLRLSLVDGFTPSLAAALLDGPDAPERAGRLFDQALERNLFFEHAGQAGWLRFQPLFGRFLRGEAERRLLPATRRQVHLRAAAWHGDRGMTGPAVRSLIAGGDPGAAAALVESAGVLALQREEWRGPRAWLAALPPGLADDRPRLAALRAAVAHLSGRPQAIRPPMTPPGDAPPPLPAAYTTVFEAAWFGPLERDPATALSTLRAAEQDLLPDDRFAIGLARSLSALATAFTGRPDEALRDLMDWTEWQSDRIDSAFIRGVFAAALVPWHQGRLDDWRLASERLLALATQGDLPVSVGWAHWNLGRIAWERDLPGDAIRHFRAASADPDRIHVACHADSVAMLALALGAGGDHRRARETLDRLHETLVDARALTLLPMIDAASARLAVLRGDPDLAPRIDALAGATLDSLPFYACSHPVLARIAALLADGSPESRQAARLDIDAGIARAEGCRHEFALVGLRAMDAALRLADGDADGARDSLRRSIAVGAPNGFRRIYRDLGPAVQPLLADIARDHPFIRGLDDLIRHLREAAEAAPPRPTPGAGRSSRGDGGVAALSPREMDALRCLCRHLSYDEIGAELSISPRTVKRHLHGVYRKLGVPNGREAIREAVRRGWCAPG